MTIVFKDQFLIYEGKFMTNDQIILYKSRLKELESNKDNIKMYAKSNCKKCYSKGVVRSVVPVGYKCLSRMEEPTEICECTIKNLKKEVIESLDG
jgi:hypothetical protein